MRALTVQQPWAWAIVHGGKDVENRTQAWTYRGTLAIHAGMRWSERGAEFRPLQMAYAAWLGFEHWDGWDGGHTAMPIDPTSDRDRELIDFGAIIGVVDLVGAHTAEDDCCESPWGEREYGNGRPDFDRARRRDIVHLELTRPRPIPQPVPCRGALGLWKMPPDVLGQVLEQIKANR